MVCAAWLGNRWGFAWPFVLSTIVLVAAVVVAVGKISVPVLALSAIAFDAMWVFANAYQAALVARLDQYGRFVILVPAAQGAGAMLGPAFIALFVSSEYYLPVNVIAISCFIISLLMFLLATHGMRMIQN